jgi:hypothetical protein
LDPRKPGLYKYDNLIFEYEPFYVGKGKNSRMYTLLRWAKGLKFVKDGNLHKYNRTKSILSEGKEPYIIKIGENLSEWDAFSLENKTVIRIGRRDLGKGPLTNLNDGGGKTYNLSKESREKISNFAKNRLGDFAGDKNPMFGVHRYGKDSPHYGKKHSEETKKRLSNLATGRKHSEETKQKMSNRSPRTAEELHRMSVASSGIKNPNSNLYIVSDKITNESYTIELVENLSTFCKSHSLKHSVVLKYLKVSEFYECDGWIFKKIKTRLYNNREQNI